MGENGGSGRLQVEDKDVKWEQFRKIACRNGCLWLLGYSLILIILAGIFFIFSNLELKMTAMLAAIVLFIYVTSGILFLWMQRGALKEYKHYYNMQWEKERFSELIEMAKVTGKKSEIYETMIDKELRYMGEYIVRYDELTQRQKRKQNR